MGFIKTISYCYCYCYCCLLPIWLCTVFFFTLAPEDPPINITATVVPRSNITSAYVLIEWKPVPDNGRLHGILRAYNIRWRRVLSSQSGTRRRRSAEDASSNGTRFEMRNLDIYTNYSVEVAAVTIKVGAFSYPVYFLSQEGGMR